MKLYIALFLTIFFIGCSTQKELGQRQNIIAYRFTNNIEQLLLKQIKEKPEENYCLLIEQGNDNSKIIMLVKEYSYFHKNTSYRALIGEKYYPISFPQFDAKYGVVEDAQSLLKRKIANKDSIEFLTKKSYPIYHGVYKIEIGMNNNIIFEGNVY